jgi:ribulose-5-phosphate 4-epimerase/fuculose-1-phosphate aldolase
VIILANHGVLITGETIAEATFRAACVDRMCRLDYDSKLLGKAITPIAPGLRKAMKASLLERGSDVYWAGAVRMLLKDEPEVLG